MSKQGRLRCPNCQAVFLLPEDHTLGQPVSCPKCEARYIPRLKSSADSPTRALPAQPEPPEPTEVSVFHPAPDAPASRRRRRWLLASLTVLSIAGVAVAVAWPKLRSLWTPTRPSDAVESVASDYLQALVDRDPQALEKLGTIETPPAIRSFREVHRNRSEDVSTRGEFGAVSDFLRRVEKEYAYDEASGRYTPRNVLGPAAETLDALHAAKEKSEKEGLAKKIASGDPEDLFDAAESLAKSFGGLAEGALAPKRLVPTLDQLIENADPPLSSEARRLLTDYSTHRETWDALLKRPFSTLKADGPFILEHAEVIASVRDALGSLGDPPRPLRLTLTRFRLEQIDTGWKVTGARREEARSPKSSGPPASEKRTETPRYSTEGAQAPADPAPVEPVP